MDTTNEARIQAMVSELREVAGKCPADFRDPLLQMANALWDGRDNRSVQRNIALDLGSFANQVRFSGRSLAAEQLGSRLNDISLRLINLL